MFFNVPNPNRGVCPSCGCCPTCGRQTFQSPLSQPQTTTLPLGTAWGGLPQGVCGLSGNVNQSLSGGRYA
jgi:hypothetical protein